MHSPQPVPPPARAGRLPRGRTGRMMVVSALAAAGLLGVGGCRTAADEAELRRSQREELKQKLAEAKRSAAEGDTGKAFSAYGRAMVLATGLNDKRSRTAAGLGLAETMTRLAFGRGTGGGGPATAPTARQAFQSYQDAINVIDEPGDADAGDPLRKVIAQNNAGAALLAAGEYPAAAAAFNAMDLTRIGKGQRYLYDYNRGRARALSGDAMGALRSYREALRDRPDFVPALDAAFAALDDFRPPDELGVTGFADLAIAGGRPEAAADDLRAALAPDPGTLRRKTDLLVRLVRCYTAGATDPVRYVGQEKPALDRTRRSAPPGLEPLAALLAEVDRAFLEAFKPPFSEPDAAGLFPAWGAQGQVELISRLLVRVGDFYRGQGDADRALARYAAAWFLDSTNTEAALYAAAVLYDSRNPTDPGQLDQRLAALVERVIEAKGNAYKNVSRLTEADWSNLVNLHMLLGGIFGQAGRWDERADDPIRTAAFQYEMAERAAQEVAKRRLARGEVAPPPPPEIRVRLAEAYAKSDRPHKAFDKFVEAGELYAAARDAGQATAALGWARSVSSENTQKHQEALRRLQDAIAGVPKATAPATESAD
jgi:tetratricopeptide (TPR) repeat protein